MNTKIILLSILFLLCASQYNYAAFVVNKQGIASIPVVKEVPSQFTSLRSERKIYHTVSQVKQALKTGSLKTRDFVYKHIETFSQALVFLLILGVMITIIALVGQSNPGTAQALSQIFGGILQGMVDSD